MGLWNEIYRPNNFKSIIGLDNSIKNINSRLPSYGFLFYGPPGTGKTTTAKVIIKHLQADSLVLNSSLDRKIEIVRSKVKDFVSTRSSNNKVKIVFLDESDGLLSPVQESLRNIIEQYNKNVQWIFTCNNINKITDALKSRLKQIQFHAPKHSDILERLKYILEKENCKYEGDALKLLIQKLYPDMRAMINELQVLTNNGKKTLTIINVKQLETLLQKVIQYIKLKDFDGARLVIINSGVNSEEFFKELYLYLMKANYPLEQKEKINEVAMQCNFYAGSALFKNIPLEGFLFALMKVGI